MQWKILTTIYFTSSWLQTYNFLYNWTVSYKDLYGNIGMSSSRETHSKSGRKGSKAPDKANGHSQVRSAIRMWDEKSYRKCKLYR